jgi:hypothetical protein
VTTLRAIKQLLLGETWILPIGLAITLAAGGMLHAIDTKDWPHFGGFILLGGVLLILLASVNRSARRRG